MPEVRLGKRADTSKAMKQEPTGEMEGGLFAVPGEVGVPTVCADCHYA